MTHAERVIQRESVSFTPTEEVCCCMLLATRAALTALDEAVRRIFNVPSEVEVEPSVVSSLGSGKISNAKGTSSTENNERMKKIKPPKTQSHELKKAQ